MEGSIVSYVMQNIGIAYFIDSKTYLGFRFSKTLFKTIQDSDFGFTFFSKTLY